MVTEMGNTNSSGDEEAGNIQQNIEAVGNEDGIKEEKMIISEGESEGCHEKAASHLPNNPSVVKEAELEKYEDDKTEIQAGSNGEARTFPGDEQPMESILEGKDELHDQPSTNIQGWSLVFPTTGVAECLEESLNGVTGTVEETPENEDIKSQLMNSEIALADMSCENGTSDWDESCKAPVLADIPDVTPLISIESYSKEGNVTENNTNTHYSAGDIPEVKLLPTKLVGENGLLGIGMEGVDKCSLEALAFSNDKDTSLKAPDSISRLTSNGIELRKSPSFDFGIPFHRRSLESDQTPLLCPTRSLSLGSNANFSNSTPDEAVAVQEKTIRMERSDSHISKHPILGLLKKETNGQTQQNHVAVEFNTSQQNETSLTSPTGTGKRKPRPSFFTTCICCAPVTH